MIGDAPGGQQATPMVFQDAAEVLVEPIPDRFADQRLPVLGAEDEVIVQAGVRRGHGGAPEGECRCIESSISVLPAVSNLRAPAFEPRRGVRR